VLDSPLALLMVEPKDKMTDMKRAEKLDETISSEQK
jgi:hypothetical protein